MEFAYTFARRISIGTKERCCPSGVSSSWSLIAPISISRCTASSIAVLDGGSRNRCSSPLVEATANLIGEAVSVEVMGVPTRKQVQVRCQKQLSTAVRKEDLGGRLPETVSNLVLCWSITHRCRNPAGIWRTHRSLELLARELSMRRYSWSIDTRSISGAGKGGSIAAFLRVTIDQHSPGRTRPARPARCLRAACEHHSSRRYEVPVATS